MINSGFLQCLQSRRARDPIALDDSLRVYLHGDELFSLSQQLRRQHTHARRPISDLIVLHLRDIHEDLRGGIVELNRLQNRRAVVRDVDVSRRHGLENFVHALGSEGRFDEIAKRECADERREAGVLRLFFCSLWLLVSGRA